MNDNDLAMPSVPVVVDDDPLIGRAVGKYRVLRKLGQGGMGAVYLVAHQSIEGNLAALKVLTLTGALWLLQAFRWCYRVFGYNYRLTTERLFHTRGMLYQGDTEVKLATVARVDVLRRPHHVLAGVGNVALTLEGQGGAKLILEGVSRPRQVAELIRQLSAQARERQVTSAKMK